MLPELVSNWKVVACQLHGRWLPPSIFAEFRYEFKNDDTYFIDWADLTYPGFMGGFPKSKTGKVVLKNDVTPHAIDFIPDEGPFAGQTLEGIFELDHDVFKANFSFPGTARPEAFTALQGQVYEVWQRV